MGGNASGHIEISTYIQFAVIHAKGSPFVVKAGTYGTPCCSVPFGDVRSADSSDTAKRTGYIERIIVYDTCHCDSSRRCGTYAIPADSIPCSYAVTAITPGLVKFSANVNLVLIGGQDDNFFGLILA